MRIPAILPARGRFVRSTLLATLLLALASPPGALAVDGTPPNGSLTINGGALYAGRTTVSVSAPATDNVGVTTMRLSNSPATTDGVLTSGANYVYRASSPVASWSLAATAYGGSTTNGARAVYVQWADAAGNWSAVKNDMIILDTVAPATNTPRAVFASPTTAGTTTAPVRVSWSGSDELSGVDRFQLQQTVDLGAWSNVTLSSPTATSVVRNLAPGPFYTFRIRARDAAGTWSAWKMGTTFRLLLHQETSSSITYTKTWTRSAVTGAMGGYTRFSDENPGIARLTFTGRAVAWVSMYRWYCGFAKVYVDGVYAARADLYSGSEKPRRVVFAKSWASSGSHQLEIRPEGTFLHPRVYIDAFFVMQ
ncbi:MAG: fibronectin type III domain-containing protein [Candidatus Limnocylindrales bacterium]